MPDNTLRTAIDAPDAGQLSIEGTMTGFKANDAHAAYLEMDSPSSLGTEQQGRLHALTADAPESIAACVSDAMASCREPADAQ